jgi:hypothetical protein
MKELRIIPYVFTDYKKQQTALILCKHAEYESRALKHMINNVKEIKDSNVFFRLTMRIVAQMALVTCIISEYGKFHKYLFPVKQYIWAEHIGNNICKIPIDCGLLLNAPKN